MAKEMKRMISGDAFGGTVRYIWKQWGDKGVRDCSKAVGMDLSHIEKMKWYDDEMHDRILIWLAKNKGEDHLEKCGEFAVQDIGILKLFLRFRHVTFLLKETEKRYDMAFNFGTIDVDVGHDKAVVKLKGNSSNKYSCQAWVGIFKGCLKITNTRGTVRETQCEMDGADCCKYVIKWA